MHVSLTGQVQKFITASRTGRRRMPNGRKIGRGTIANYKACHRLLSEYEEKQNRTVRVYAGLHIGKQVFTQERKYWQQFYHSWSDFLYGKGYFDNYIADMFKILRTLLNWLHKEKGWLVNSIAPSGYITKEQISIVVLSPEQLQFLINDSDFQRSLSPCLQRVKDIFVTGCTVALRVSDLLKLTGKNIEEAGGRHYLVVHSGKTQARTRVLLPDYIMEIFKKYNRKYKTLLPPMANGNLNIQLKVLAEKAGWTDIVAKTRMQRGIAQVRYKDKRNKKLHRFCDLVTSHTMRRTAITTMLTLGMPEHLVRKVSGHAANSREFYRYVNLSQQYLDKETTRVFDLLGGKQTSEL